MKMFIIAATFALLAGTTAKAQEICETVDYSAYGGGMEYVCYFVPG